LSFEAPRWWIIEAAQRRRPIHTAVALPNVSLMLKLELLQLSHRRLTVSTPEAELLMGTLCSASAWAAEQHRRFAPWPEPAQQPECH
jgi:hypothetical protein